MVHRKVEPEELAHMLRDRKMTRAEIAAETGLTESGVTQAAVKYGLVEKRMSHKWALPWKIAAGPHGSGKVAKYLRDLSSVAQGKDIPEANKVTAVRWAQDLVKRGLDIDYDRDESPNEESIVGGFFTKPAPKKVERPEDWHLKYVLDRAKAGITQKL